MLNPVEAYRTCDLPGDIWTPCPPSGSAHALFPYRIATKRAAMAIDLHAMGKEVTMSMTTSGHYSSHTDASKDDSS